MLTPPQRPARLLSDEATGRPVGWPVPPPESHDTGPAAPHRLQTTPVAAASPARARCPAALTACSHLRQVSATDPDCGVNAQVNYSIGHGFRKLESFSIRSDTGEICISAPLDHERRAIYEFPVVAMDRGQSETSARRETGAAV